MLVVKHGEYGATAFFGKSPQNVGATTFRAPALPLEEVVDPTGAGDSFAGGFFGYLASQPQLTPGAFRRAMFYGSRDGFVHRRALWHRTSATADTRGDRRTLQRCSAS